MQNIILNGNNMIKFKVVYIESYEHTITIEANCYEEAAFKADQALTKDNVSYCSKDPNWFLHSIEKDTLPKRSRKQLCCAT